MDFSFLKSNNKKKELKYYLSQYKEAVKRHNHWKHHPLQSEQIAGLVNKSSESAKIHLNSAILKYRSHLHQNEQSPKVKDEKVRSLAEQIITSFEKNGLGRKTMGNRGKMITDLLHLAMKEGAFLDLRHNLQEQRTPEEMEIELEYRNTVAQLFQHDGIAKDTSNVILNEFDKIEE